MDNPHRLPAYGSADSVFEDVIQYVAFQNSPEMKQLREKLIKDASEPGYEPNRIITAILKKIYEQEQSGEPS